MGKFQHLQASISCLAAFGLALLLLASCNPTQPMTDSPNMAGSNLYTKPWVTTNNAIVLDPYGQNDLDLPKVAMDARVTAIIHKATQGLRPPDTRYESRKKEAKSAKFLWGSYHLLTTDNVKQQIDHYLAVTGRHADETYAIDVECTQNTTDCKSGAFRVTPQQVMQALDYFRMKTGHWPLLYMNHSTTTEIAPFLAKDQKYADVPLWYARYKNDISDVFPIGPWGRYTLWQFSSESNCKPNADSCPYRVPGTKSDMDINIATVTPSQLRRAWPLNR